MFCFPQKIPLQITAPLLQQKKEDFSSSFVLGWSHKSTAYKARRDVVKHNLPYIALEDGLLCSRALGCKGVQPLSPIMDHTGIYFDAGDPPDLENLLNASG